MNNNPFSFKGCIVLPRCPVEAFQQSAKSIHALGNKRISRHGEPSSHQPRHAKASRKHGYWVRERIGLKSFLKRHFLSCPLF